MSFIDSSCIPENIDPNFFEYVKHIERLAVVKQENRNQSFIDALEQVITNEEKNASIVEASNKITSSKTIENAAAVKMEFSQLLQNASSNTDDSLELIVKIEDEEMLEQEESPVPEIPMIIEQPLMISNDSSIVYNHDGKDFEAARSLQLTQFIKFCRMTNPFKCMSKKCLYSTSQLSEMRDHVVKHENSEGSLKCAYCLNESKNVKELEKHIVEDHKKDIYQCKNCYHLTENSELMQQHYKISHPDIDVTQFLIKLKMI